MTLFVFSDYVYYFNKLYPGIYFKEVHLGGKSSREVEELLDNAQLTFLGPEEKSMSIPFKEMGIELNAKEVFETGYWQGRPKPWPFSYGNRLQLKKEGSFIPFQYDLDYDIFAQQVHLLMERFSQESENAYFKVHNSTEVEIIPEKVGYKFHPEELEVIILDNLAQPDVSLEVRVPYAEKWLPEITMATLREKGIEDLMVSFTTRFDPEVTNRVHNLALASAELHNYFLSPGEVLALNKIIGDTTAEKGYKKAPVIVGGILAQGVGGGLCQISSTLYNAALLANVKILERHNHLLTVPYIDPGRDATISYPSLDLKFRNNKDHTILVTAELEYDTLTFRLFGRPVEEKVDISTNVLHTFPPSVKYEYAPDLHPGEEEIIEGIPGYLVEVWKRVYRDDELESEEKISVDRYLPHSQIIRRGP